MNTKDKYRTIEYTEYKYEGRKYNSDETEEFFDLDLSKLLYENADKIINSQNDLLSYFDFSKLFRDFSSGISQIQNYLLKFMVLKNVRDRNQLLKDMPDNLEVSFFSKLYIELYEKDNRPFWFSSIVNSLKSQNQIPFIKSVISEITDDELLYLIKDLYENRNDQTLRALLSYERFIDVAVNRVNAPFFYEMIEKLNLPDQDSLIEKRKEKLKHIIENNTSYSPIIVKNAYCDLFFHNLPSNVLLDLKTIIEFANADKTLQDDYLKDVYDLLYTTYTLLTSQSFDPKGLMIAPINYEIIDKSYKLCQKRFQDLVSQSINKDITAGIEPKTLLSSNGIPVKVYEIENQTENQKNITMLLSTIPSTNSAKDFKNIYCSNQNGEITKGRRSCSIVDEAHLKLLFGGENRIVLGYDDISGRIITSATLGDGRTDGNEIRYRKHRKVNRSSYLPISNFIENTQSHNELAINMGTTNQVMQPSYLLVTRTPTQLEIDIAAEFQIPIRKISIDKYEQKPHMPFISEDYDYYHFEKAKIESNQHDNKKA